MSHNPESPRRTDNHLARYFTLPGRILVVVTVVLGAGAPIAVFWFLHDSLRPGRYPLLFFALPVWIGLAFAFAIVVAILRRMGIPILRRQEIADSDHSGKNAPPTNS